MTPSFPHFYTGAAQFLNAGYDSDDDCQIIIGRTEPMNCKSVIALLLLVASMFLPAVARADFDTLENDDIWTSAIDFDGGA